MIGAIIGLIESIRSYPLGSWIPVILYLSFLGTLAGAVLGVVAGSVGVVAREHRPRLDLAALVGSFARSYAEMHLVKQ